MHARPYSFKVSHENTREPVPIHNSPVRPTVLSRRQDMPPACP